MDLISRTGFILIAGYLFCIGVVCASTEPLTDYFERRYGVQPDTGIMQLHQQEEEADRQAAIMVESTRDLSIDEIKELRRQAKEEIAEMLRQRDQKLAELGSDITDEQKKQVEQEYQRKLALIDLNLKYSRLSIGLPEDSTALFTAKSIEIHGNSLLTDQEILNLQKLPMIFEDSCDFKVLHELIIRPADARDPGYRISQKTIQGFTRYILSLYEKRGYRGIYVYVAAESLVDGTKLKDDILRIDVLEAAISDIKISYKVFDAAMDRDPNVTVPYRELREGEKPHLNPFLIESWSPSLPGEVINIKELDDYTNLLNLNPDRYVSATVSKSSEPDHLNLEYNVYENNPWHFYIQSDNSGTEETRWNPRIGLINTNLLGMDDRLNLVYWGPLQDKPFEPFDKNWSVFGNYEFPIFTPRLRLSLYGGYSDYQRFTPAAGGITFFGTGSFYGTLLRYNLFQMTLFQEDRWFFDLIGGVRRENSKSNFLGATQYDIDVDLWNAGAELYGYWDTKRLVSSSLAFNRSQSMSASSRMEFQEARLNSDPDFMFYTLSASHSQYSKTRLHRLLGRFRFINSDGRLIPANMTSFGGLYTVRGYEEYEVVADGGIQWSLQYEYDLVKHFESQEGGKLGPFSKLALLAFTDNGRAVNKDPVAGEQEVVEMASYGAGLNATIAESLDMGVYYGVPLRSTDQTNSGNGRWNFTFMLQF